MIRIGENKRVEALEHIFNGEGSITVRHIADSPEEMNDKGRVFAHTTVQPGCSIGYHIHKGESETYYIIRGTAEFNDSGITKTVSTGDVTFTPNGQGHGIKNIGDEPLEIIALILYE